VGYSLLPGFIEGLDLDGGYVYAGWELCNWWYFYACSGGLKVLDVSDPAHPLEVSSYDLPNSASGLTVTGGYAYVLWKAEDYYHYHEWGGMKILDVSNPAVPVEVGSIDYSGDDGAPLGMTITNGYGYVVADYLYTYDLTDPTAPVLVDTSRYSGKDIAVFGDYAYVVGCCGLLTMSLADPAHPVFTGSVGVDGMTEAVALQVNYAYLSETGYFSGNAFVFGGLRVIDVISPTAPVEVAYLPLPYGSRGVAIKDNQAYVAEVYNGLSIVDISTPTDPQEIGNYSAPGEVDAVVTTGSHAYLAAGYAVPDSDGLWTINVSNRNNPVVTGYYEVLESRILAVDGNYAYMLVSYYANMKFNNYLHVVNISNPAQPTGVSSYPLPTDEAAFDLDASNGYVYVAQTERLEVVDMRNPTAPVTTDVITATNAIYDVAVSDSYAYVSDGSLRVFDLGDPAHPVEIGFLPLSGYVSTLAVSGQHVYIAGGTGLYVVDISDPAHPTEAGSTAIASGDVVDIAAAGSFAFLAAYDAGLRVVDATDPIHPFETAFYDTPQVTHGVYTSGGYVYVADYKSGLYIFRFNPLIHEIFLPLVMK
jgi:hypothetical protein